MNDEVRVNPFLSLRSKAERDVMEPADVIAAALYPHARGFTVPSCNEQAAEMADAVLDALAYCGWQVQRVASAHTEEQS